MAITCGAFCGQPIERKVRSSWQKPNFGREQKTPKIRSHLLVKGSCHSNECENFPFPGENKYCESVKDHEKRIWEWLRFFPRKSRNLWGCIALKQIPTTKFKSEAQVFMIIGYWLGGGGRDYLIQRKLTSLWTWFWMLLWFWFVSGWLFKVYFKLLYESWGCFWL